MSNKNKWSLGSLKTRLGLYPTQKYSLPRSVKDVKARFNNLLLITTPAEIIGKPIIGGIIGYSIGGETGGIIGAISFSVLDVLTLLQEPKTPSN